MLTEKKSVRGDAAPYREAGQWLRSLRRYWQITEAELAEQVGVATREIVAGLEAGQFRLPRSMYVPMAQAFSMDAGEFAESCDLYYGDPAAIRSAA